MSMSPIKERYVQAWHEGVDQLLTTLAAPAAEFALAEDLGDKKALEAATSHLKTIGKVRVHFKDERRMWLQGGGPARAVALAKQTRKKGKP